MIICNGTQADSALDNNLENQTSLLVLSSKSQETFFDVVKEAAKQARISSPVFTNHNTTAPNHHPSSFDETRSQPVRAKGYIRKGLREKLAFKAEQARLQVQKLETIKSIPIGELEEHVNKRDSGIGSDTLGGTDSYESVGYSEGEPGATSDTDIT